MINLEKYRDKWFAEKFDDYVGFYNREFYCLDNFSAFGFVYGGKYYATVEHAYQSLKFKDTAPEIAGKIAACFSADETKRLARFYAYKQAKNWDDIKVSVMEELLRAKLAQNPYVVKKLLETENYLICEDSPKDSFWGIGAERNGRNELGKLWMKLREELKNGDNV